MEYILKQIPEDFVVKENIPELSEGKGYILLMMEKRDCDMMSSLEKISRHFGISKREIGYCGMKDKKAVTYQYITIPPKVKKEQISKFNDQRISLSYVKEVDEPLHLGDLKSNSFEITVRGLAHEKQFEIEKIPNYFGEQRFGSNNDEIGRSLVKRDFQKAVQLLLLDNKRKKQILSHLEDSPNDYVGALGKVPLDILIFFIHSFQSRLWNDMLSLYISKEGITNLTYEDTLAIPGFGSECSEKFIDYYDEVLENEGIEERDFIIREIPRLSSEGDERRVLMHYSNLSYDFENDEKNEKKKKCVLCFSLSKGSYATVLVDSIFKHL